MPEKRLEKTRQEYCGHKFVDSIICLKCGKQFNDLVKESSFKEEYLKQLYQIKITSQPKSEQ
jgi:ABC-type enterochelin transport system ATPase subunit